MMKPGLREHMPKEETSRRQIITATADPTDCIHLPTGSTREGTMLIRHYTKATQDLRRQRQRTHPKDFTLCTKLTASN